MAIENLEKCTEIIEKDNLTPDEEIKRYLYLRKLLTGEVYGPLTNVPNIDKEWLVNYSTEDIEGCVVPKETMYSYVLKNNLDNLDAVALSYFGNDYTYRDLFGDGKENEVFQDILGDYLAIAKTDKTLLYGGSEVFKSQHAGYTNDEILVPLIVIDTDKILNVC